MSKDMGETGDPIKLAITLMKIWPYRKRPVGLVVSCSECIFNRAKTIRDKSGLVPVEPMDNGAFSIVSATVASFLKEPAVA